MEAKASYQQNVLIKNIKKNIKKDWMYGSVV